MSRFAFAAFLICSMAALLPAAEPVVEKDLVFAKPDGEELKLDFVRPAGDGPFPLVIFLHGGGWRGGSRAEYAQGQLSFAKLGFASAAVQYRFAPKHKYPTQINDITEAIQYLAKNKVKFAIDPERIGLMGASAGGHLALMVGFGETKGYKIRGIVNVCGPTDLRTFESTPAGDKVLKTAVGRTSLGLLEDLLGSADRQSAIYAESSPVKLVRKDVPPVLTLHGDADDLVPLSQAQTLHAALEKAGAKHRLITVKGGGHDFAKWPEKERGESMLAAIAFFNDHLKTK
ncbi:MAG: alpha/beta hydrolase fold domain-containing protein [Fimbriiglobus sp.]